MFKMLAVLSATFVALVLSAAPALANTVTNNGAAASGSNVENSHHHEFSNCSGLLTCVDLLDL